MSQTLEKEIRNICELYAKDGRSEQLKEVIIQLLDKKEKGLLKDEKIDRSHISIRQTEIF